MKKSIYFVITALFLTTLSCTSKQAVILQSTHLSIKEINDYMKMGRELSAQQKYEAAAEIFRKIIEDDTTNGEALIRCGFALTRLDQLAEARFYLTRVIDNRCGDIAEARLLRGTVYQENGSYDLALKDFNAYLSTKGSAIDSGNCLFRRATCYFQKNEFDAVIADCDHCLGKFEYEEYVRELLGDTYCRLGQPEVAVSQYRKALKIVENKKSLAQIDRIRNKVQTGCDRAEAAPALQRQIDDADTGAVIEIKAGTYDDHFTIANKIGLRIVVTGGVAEVGVDNERQTILTIHRSSNIVLEGFHFLHKGEHSSVTAVKIDSCDEITLRNCEIDGNGNGGIHAKDAKNLRIIKCSIHGCETGISTWNVDGCKISECRFWNNGFFNAPKIFTQKYCSHLEFTDNNNRFPDNAPVPETWLKLLKQSHRIPYFNTAPYLLTANLTIGGKEESVLLTQHDNFLPDNELVVAIISPTNKLDTVHLPVNQNFSWGLQRGAQVYSAPEPDKIKCEFNTKHDIWKGWIGWNDEKKKFGFWRKK
jgi:parallel beta-helix repeat protein